MASPCRVSSRSSLAEYAYRYSKICASLLASLPTLSSGWRINMEWNRQGQERVPSSDKVVGQTLFDDNFVPSRAADVFFKIQQLLEMAPC